MNLKANWSTLWSTISGAIGNRFVSAIALIGVAVIVLFLLKYFWDRHKVGPKGASFPTWPIVVGAVLCGPDILLPVVLGIVDSAIDGFKAVGSKFS